MYLRYAIGTGPVLKRWVAALECSRATIKLWQPTQRFLGALLPRMRAIEADIGDHDSERKDRYSERDPTQHDYWFGYEEGVDYNGAAPKVSLRQYR